MKTITFPEMTAFDPKKQLHVILSGAPEAGYTIADVRFATKILDKLDSEDPTSNVLELEDSEHAFVLNRLRSVPWMVAHPDIIKFTDAIEGAA